MDIVDAYRVFDLRMTASETELKNAYRTLVLKNHPDKGGDPNTFMHIQEAFEKITEYNKSNNGNNGNNGNIKDEQFWGGNTSKSKDEYDYTQGWTFTAGGYNQQQYNYYRDFGNFKGRFNDAQKQRNAQQYKNRRDTVRRGVKATWKNWNGIWCVQTTAQNIRYGDIIEVKSKAGKLAYVAIDALVDSTYWGKIYTIQEGTQWVD